ncbi:5794_t:CDS:2, partial [Cetraspora pellucida]
PEALDNQVVELEVLAAYDSTDDLSDIDIDNFGNIEEISVDKTFNNWNQVADFMRKYAISKGHRIRIGSSRRINAITKETIKQTYVCQYAEKLAKSSMTFNNQHIGHELNLLASQFDPTLCKLPKSIIEEICFLTTVAKADATMQYRIIQEKYNIRIYQPDLYKIIQMFRHNSDPDEDDAGMLLKRLNEKKIEDPCWFVLIEFDPVTSSLTHLFWMSPKQQIL